MDTRQIEEILERHQRWLDTAGQEGAQADFRGADLRGYYFFSRNLRHVDFRGGNLRRTRFIGSDMYGANFRKADLTLASLYRTILCQADFREAAVRETLFRSSDLSWADFRATDLRGTVFTGSNLYATDFGATRVIQIGPLGSRKDYLVVMRHPDGVVEARAGCFRGSLDALVQQVIETHATPSRFRREYEAAIAYCRTALAIEEGDA